MSSVKFLPLISRTMFDSNTQPKYLEKEEWIIRDVHCVPSLIKLFFRELPASPLQAMTNNNNEHPTNSNGTASKVSLILQSMPSHSIFFCHALTFFQ